MRNTLITIAAWTAAIAITTWQRLLWPAIKNFLPGIEDLFSPVRTNAVQTESCLLEPAPAAQLETVVIERSKPARPQRLTRHKPAAAGFAS